jgi:hypothetical protein
MPKTEKTEIEGQFRCLCYFSPPMSNILLDKPPTSPIHVQRGELTSYALLEYDWAEE